MLGAGFYWTENQSYFPGPNTSGVGLHRGGVYAGSAAASVQDWDFISPAVGKQMGFLRGSTEPTRLQKLQSLLMTELKCPENQLRYFRRFQGAPLPMTNSSGEKGTPAMIPVDMASEFVDQMVEGLETLKKGCAK